MTKEIKELLADCLTFIHPYDSWVLADVAKELTARLEEALEQGQNLPLHIVSGSNIAVGDAFVLNIKKPKCTTGQEYIVSEVRYNSSSGFEYMFYNDHEKPTTMYDGEYYR